VRDFIRATQGECPVPASGRDALQAQRIIDAAYESSRTGRRVAVPPPG
jgi:predicted dehydrogenase